MRLVQGSPTAKLANLVGFLVQTEPGVWLDMEAEQPLLPHWLTWTQLLPVQLPEEGKLAEGNPGSWH